MTQPSMEVPATSAEAPARGSTLAVLSAACSILSVLGCFATVLVAVLVNPVAAVALLLMPVLGFTGALLGALALGQISRSKGRMIGRPVALMGLFLGLIAGVTQGAAAFGAVAPYLAVRRELVPIVESTGHAFSAGDFTRARVALAPITTGQLSDEDLRDFMQAIESRCGRMLRVEAGLDLFIKTAEMVREAQARGGGTMAAGGAWPRPVELVCERARVVAYIVLDEEGVSRKVIRISDMVVVLPAGEGVALRKDGPAEELGRVLKLTMVEH